MDLLERAGEGYLTRKVMGLPQQLENAARKQWKQPNNSRPPPEVHSPAAPPRKNSLGDLRNAERDEEMARLRKELAAAKLERNDARYAPNSTYPRRRDSKDLPHSPVYSEREAFHPKHADPRREIVRDQHDGRLVNVAKPRRSSTTTTHEDPEPQIVEIGRSRSVSSYAPSRAPSHASSHATSHVPSHAPSYHRTPRHYDPHQPHRVPVYRGPQSGIIALPAASESHHDSQYSPPSPAPHPADDSDTISNHTHHTHQTHRSRHTNNTHKTRRTSLPPPPGSIVLSNAGSRASKSRNVEYGWEKDQPKSRWRSEYGWDVGSWASGVPEAADAASQQSRSHGHHGHHGRERVIRNERITTRTPIAGSPALPMAPAPPVSAKLSAVGSVKGSVRGSVKDSVVGGGKTGNNQVDEYNLIEIDGADLIGEGTGVSTLPEDYDVIEVIEDGVIKVKKVKRRRRRSVKRIEY